MCDLILLGYQYIHESAHIKTKTNDVSLIEFDFYLSMGCIHIFIVQEKVTLSCKPIVSNILLICYDFDDVQAVLHLLSSLCLNH